MHTHVKNATKLRSHIVSLDQERQLVFVLPHTLLDKLDTCRAIPPQTYGIK